MIVGYALRESLRRKVFLIVLMLSCAFLGLYGIGVWRAFRDTALVRRPPDQLGLDPAVVTGATVLGLAMFATLFLGTVLAIFLTLGVVRGDAERGCCSRSSSVRSAGRRSSLAGLLAAAAVCAVYVAALFAAETAITGLVGGWWPDHAVLAGAQLAYRGRRRRRALAARLGLPVGDRERDRGLHGLRRQVSSPGCSPRSAGRSARTRSARSAAGRRGRCRSRRSTRTACTRSRRTRAGSPASPSSSARSAARSAAAHGLRLWAVAYLAAGRGGGPRGVRAPRPCPSSRRSGARPRGRPSRAFRRRSKMVATQIESAYSAISGIISKVVVTGSTPGSATAITAIDRQADPPGAAQPGGRQDAQVHEPEHDDRHLEDEPDREQHLRAERVVVARPDQDRVVARVVAGQELDRRRQRDEVAEERRRRPSAASAAPTSTRHRPLVVRAERRARRRPRPARSRSAARCSRPVQKLTQTEVMNGSATPKVTGFWSRCGSGAFSQSRMCPRKV